MAGRALVFAVGLSIVASAATADTYLAARTLRSHTVVTEADLALQRDDQPAYWAGLEDIVGQETRHVVYQGRPLRPEDLGPQALVERNQPVSIVFRAGGLEIAAEGRSLGRGGIGDDVKVMNLASRKVVTGFVGADGAIHVAGRETGR